MARTDEFIRRNIAGQKTKQAQARRKVLEKLERVERPEDVWASAGRVRFRFAEAPRSGDLVLEAHGLGATRGGKALFEGFDILVRRGDRIAQLVIAPVAHAEWEERESLDDTDRGEGGFGHTGVEGTPGAGVTSKGSEGEGS